VTALDPVSAAFAANLRRLRLDRKLSQTALGQMADVHHTGISLIENGAGTTIATAGRLAKALGVPVGDMFATEGTP
jgi:transcriptional regulator with XRE-family HTH domain